MSKTETQNILQFKVPQNVQREDTIIGPLTLKQMIILGVGGGIAYAIYVSLARTYFVEIWLPPVLIVSTITLAFAFLKIHSMPFHIFLMNLIEYKILPHKRIWIQGTGEPFVSSFQKEAESKKPVKTETAENTQKQKSIDELTSMIDQNKQN